MKIHAQGWVKTLTVSNMCRVEKLGNGSLLKYMKGVWWERLAETKWIVVC